MENKIYSPKSVALSGVDYSVTMYVISDSTDFATAVTFSGFSSVEELPTRDKLLSLMDGFPSPFAVNETISDFRFMTEDEISSFVEDAIDCDCDDEDFDCDCDDDDCDCDCD